MQNDRNYPMVGSPSISKSHVGPGIQQKPRIWTLFSLINLWFLHKSVPPGADLWLFEKTWKHAKSRTTAENIAYRTNQLPVGAQDFAPTACNPTISKILLSVVNFTERKRIKSRTRFSAKSTQNLKICTKSTHFLIVFLNILAPFWHCRVTPYRDENLSLFPRTFETRSSREIA